MSRKKTLAVKHERHLDNGHHTDEGSSKLIIAVTHKNEGQKNALRLISQNKVTIISGCPGSGKAQPLDAIVYTPDGPKKMGEIRIGQRVCTPDGSSAKVLAIYPQGEKDIYRLNFTDGSTTECCEDHLWRISERFTSDRSKKIIVDTKYLIENITKNGDRNIYIELTHPVKFKTQDLLIDPYIMGILIGDGCLCGPNICLSSVDNEIVCSVSNSLLDGYSLKKCIGDNCDYRLVKTTRTKLNGSLSNQYKDALRLYDLYGKMSHEKHIPEDYLYGSEEQRWALLQGLMDADGSVSNKSGQAYFCTSSDLLAKDFKILVNSLGGLCTITEKYPTLTYKGTKKQGRKSFILHLNMLDCTKAFRLNRKKDICKPRVKYLPKRVLVSVERIGQKPAQCILIDSAEHLYLTDNFIVTHNTFISVMWGLQEMLMHDRFEKLIFTRPVVEAGESLGYLPGDANAKIAPYMIPIMDILERSLSYGAIETLIKERRIVIMPLAYMRGVTFVNSYVVADEAQNMSMKQMHLLLTRIGEKSKVVITGDTDQSDLFQSRTVENGLQDAISRLSGINDIGLIELGYDSCVRDPLVNEIDARYRPRRFRMPTMKGTFDGSSEDDLQDPRMFDCDAPQGL